MHLYVVTCLKDKYPIKQVKTSFQNTQAQYTLDMQSFYEYEHMFYITNIFTNLFNFVQYKLSNTIKRYLIVFNEVINVLILYFLCDISYSHQIKLVLILLNMLYLALVYYFIHGYYCYHLHFKRFYKPILLLTNLPTKYRTVNNRLSKNSTVLRAIDAKQR